MTYYNVIPSLRDGYKIKVYCKNYSIIKITLIKIIAVVDMAENKRLVQICQSCSRMDKYLVGGWRKGIILIGRIIGGIL